MIMKIFTPYHTSTLEELGIKGVDPNRKKKDWSVVNVPVRAMEPGQVIFFEFPTKDQCTEREFRTAVIVAGKRFHGKGKVQVKTVEDKGKKKLRVVRVPEPEG